MWKRVLILRTIFRQIDLEVAQIWRELAPHYFPADCFEGGSDLAGTGSTLFSSGLFWRQLSFGETGATLFSSRLFWRRLRFGGNWLHIIFRWIVLEAAQIWRELASKTAQIWRVLAPHYFSVDCLEAAQFWRELAPRYFPAD